MSTTNGTTNHVAPGGLLHFSIKNFRGVVSLEAAPNGRSFELRGANSVGKTGAVDALFWGMGGRLDDEITTNGADETDVSLTYDEFVIRRTKSRDGKASLIVKDSGRRKLPEPGTFLAAFRQALARNTFSQQSPEEQAETLLRLAPGLDVSDIEKRHAELYAERTVIGRRCAELRALASGIKEPPAAEPPGEEIPLADLRARRSKVREVEAANNRVRADFERSQTALGRKSKELEAARQAVEAARTALARAEDLERKAVEAKEQALAAAESLEATVTALVDPDQQALDSEEEQAERHNAAVRARREAAKDAERVRQERLTRVAAADQEDTRYKAHTEQMAALERIKAERLAAVTLPVAGIAVAGKRVTFDDGTHGPVVIGSLNSAAQIRLDVVLAQAQGQRLVAIRNASLLDDDGLAAVEEFAHERGVQLIAERVTSGEPLSVVIEEDETTVARA